MKSKKGLKCLAVMMSVLMAFSVVPVVGGEPEVAKATAVYVPSKDITSEADLEKFYVYNFVDSSAPSKGLNVSISSALQTAIGAKNMWNYDEISVSGGTWKAHASSDGDLDTEYQPLVLPNPGKTHKKDGTSYKVTSYDYMFYCKKNVEDNFIMDKEDANSFDYNSDWGQLMINSDFYALDLRLFDTSNVTDMNHMFHMMQFENDSTADEESNRILFGATSGTSAYSGFDTSGVTDMSYMFNQCNVKKLYNFYALNTRNVTTMAHMFDGCSELKTITPCTDTSEYMSTCGNNFVTSKVTDMSYMFKDCSSLTSVPVNENTKFTTENVTNFEGMFKGCESFAYATTINSKTYSSLVDTSTLKINMDTSNGTNFSHMFEGTKMSPIPLESFDLSGATDMSYMFANYAGSLMLNVKGLKETGNVINMSHMFEGAKLSSDMGFSGLDTSRVTDMSYMFSGLSADGTKTIDLSNFDFSQVTDASHMFAGSSALTTITFPTGDDKEAIYPKNYTIDMTEMFKDCKALTALDLTCFKLNNKKVHISQSMKDMFKNTCADSETPVTGVVVSQEIAEFLNGSASETYENMNTGIDMNHLVFEPKYFTLTYDCGEGSGTMEGEFAKKGTEMHLKKCTFTAPEGKIFSHWQIGDETRDDGAFYTINGNVAAIAIYKDDPNYVKDSGEDKKEEDTNTENKDTQDNQNTDTNTNTSTGNNSDSNTSTSTGNNSDSNTNTGTASNTDNRAAVLAVGDTLTDSSSNGKYTVTNADSAKGTVTYAAPANKKATTVTVPATVTINGITCKVTAIKANAFKNNKKLKKITIGKNIATIGKKAFYGCKNLKKITIKTTKLTAKSVGKNAFKGIHKKAVVKVPKKKKKAYKKILRKRGINGKKQKIK